MNAFDSQAEDSPTSLGRSLRRRPLARKKLSEMVEEELEQMIRRHEFGEGEQLPSERELMGIAHFDQLRLFFESSLVRYAAEHATDEQIALLTKALEINSQSLDDNALFIRSDVEFHRVLAEIPGNPIFMAIHVALLDWLIAARPSVPDRELHEHNNVSYQQHIVIVDAIRQRDPDKADRALQTHLNSVSATWHALGKKSQKMR